MTTIGSYPSYNVSGKNNLHGSKGASGSSGGSCGSAGSHGSDGSNGLRGHDAGTVKLQLMAIEGRVVVADPSGKHILKLGDSEGTIFLAAKGGNGGRGGDGGSGGNGATGSHGSNATQLSYGGNGGRGGDGGAGGNGGDGGDGGHGGSVTLTMESQDTDLLMLTNVPDVSAGKGGKGGSGGRGGSGGAGGQGGSGYTWTTSYTTHHTDAQGHCHTDTHHQSHHNPGGCSGSRGSSGSSGTSGKNGSNGRDGTYEIWVGDTRYLAPYNLKVVDSRTEDYNSDGVIEPGEVVKLFVTYVNNGGMPLPVEPIRLWVKDTRWVEFDEDSALTAPPSLKAGKTYETEKPLSFRVPRAKTKVGAPFTAEAIIDYRATAVRVNREFQDVAKHTTKFIVRYPVEMGKIIGSKSICLDEEASYTFALANVSQKKMGKDRVVQLYLKVVTGETLKPNDVELFDLNNKKSLQLEKKIASLKAGQKTTLPGTLKFSNTNLPPYSRIKLRSELHLGDQVGDKIRHIQTRFFEIQLAEAYRYEKKADFLLVTHCETMQEEVEVWEEVAGRLGLKMCIWNTSLYQGIDLTLKLTAGTLLDNFAHKTIVFLNQHYENDIADNCTATSLLPSFQLFNAAKERGIRTLVVGEKVASDKYLFASELSTPNVVRKTYAFKGPSPMKMRSIMEEKIDSLRKEDPRRVHVFVTKYLGEITEEGCFSVKCNLFQYQQYEAPLANRITLLQIPCETHDSAYIKSDQNLFSFLKMLPIEKKAEILGSCEHFFEQAVSSAILSDLADELSVFSQDRWCGKWGKRELKEGLNVLHDLLSIENPPVKLKALLIRLRAFVDRLPTTWDQLMINRRQRVLANAVKSLIDTFLKKRLSCKKEDWQEEYRACKESMKLIDRTELWQQFRNPYAINAVQNPQSSRTIDQVPAAVVGSRPVVGRNHFETEEERLFAIDRLNEFL